MQTKIIRQCYFQKQVGGQISSVFFLERCVYTKIGDAQKEHLHCSMNAGHHCESRISKHQYVVISESVTRGLTRPPQSEFVSTSMWATIKCACKDAMAVAPYSQPYIEYVNILKPHLAYLKLNI